MDITVIDHSSIVQLDELETVVWAINDSLIQFGRTWGCTVQVSCSDSLERRSDNTILVANNKSSASRAGFYDPNWSLIVKDEVEHGRQWSVSLSRMVMLAALDPEVNHAVQDGSGRTLSKDCIVDAVAGVTVQQGAVALADYLLPSWFHPDADGPFDVAGVLKRPGQISGKGWVQVYSHGRWDTRGGFSPNPVRYPRPRNVQPVMA